jgi:threonine dehydrogenase-like Zn-dependent dehydrogenase
LNLSDPDAEKKLLDLNAGKKADVVIECSGNTAVVDKVFDYVRPGGRIHLQGQYRQPIIITRYARWNCSDLKVSASIALNPGDKEAILKLISERKFDAKSLYEKEYFVDDAPQAYRELEKHRYEISKILFKWES